MSEQLPDVPPSKIAVDDSPVRYKSARAATRGLLVQGLYTYFVSKNSAEDVRIDTELDPAFRSVDRTFFREAWAGVIEALPELEGALMPHLDRPLDELSPIERAVLSLGAWELRDRIDVPYRVVMNEAVELAKRFGGTDGHKFVNGVLDRLVPTMRKVEFDAAQTTRA